MRNVIHRDGVQTAKLGSVQLEKMMLNIYLNEFGVFHSEFGVPISSYESYYLQANLELVEIGVLKPIVLERWLRAIPEDVKLAFKKVHDIKHLNLAISTYEQMIHGNLAASRIHSQVSQGRAECPTCPATKPQLRSDMGAIWHVALYSRYPL